MTFDDIRKIAEDGNEYWEARELQVALGYAKWENFHKVIKQAMISCKISQQDVSDHFPEVGKSVEMPSNAKPRTIIDYHLTRYACYLVVMNGDPRKEVIALGQTYFAVKTRQQELQEIYELLTEDERRLFLRGDIKQKNMLLAEAARNAGIKTSFEYAEFQNSGYKGLYGGMTALDIAISKGVASEEDILDYMGSVELGANLFRITQTESLMKKNGVDNKEDANATHYRVGSAVRKTIEEIGGTMPEDLPPAEKSIKELEKSQKQKIKGKTE
ncbi:MAG: DNA damage-inducible protein D [Bacillota bacterium]